MPPPPPLFREHYVHHDRPSYGVATVSRIDKVIGLIGRILSLL